VCIPARNEEFLDLTIKAALDNAEADTEVIAVLDGYWPNPPIVDNEKVTLIHHTKPVGQRAGVNEAARLSKAKYIMKADAHCSFAKGYDKALIADCEYDWTVVPMMYNLHAFDWKCMSCGDRTYQAPKPKVCGKCNKETDFERIMVWQPRRGRKTISWRFDSDLHFQYWHADRNRPEIRPGVQEIMSFVGAGWFMHRDRYLEIDGLDENHGSWGQVGTEMSCKA
jgi:glycosyltransferase involved in cell wall biosynthesis